MDVTYRKRVVTKRLILHDSHTVPSQSNLEHFLAVKGRTMGLLNVGYHFLITRDRGVIACRPHDVIGAHCPGYDRESIGICLAGGVEKCHPRECVHAEDICDNCTEFPTDNFTPTQKQDLKDLVAYLRECYGPVRLWGHTELPRHTNHPHACPPLDMHELRSFIDG